MSLEFALGPIDIQLWRPANGGFSRFRCSRAVSTLRSESRKTTIFASPSSECRLVLGFVYIQDFHWRRIVIQAAGCLEVGMDGSTGS
ncbi:hypothetical protein, partial [Sphingopyxis sp. SCN 67-31]|uniref:hypothetical protein n=1 Tax=Sphingopyxis sp. SCN 67-31 TaxID=1660142 RepID=UPI0025799DF1